MRSLTKFFTLRGRLLAEGADGGSTSGGRAVFGRLGKGLMMGQTELRRKLNTAVRLKEKGSCAMGVGQAMAAVNVSTRRMVTALATADTIHLKGTSSTTTATSRVSRVECSRPSR